MFSVSKASANAAAELGAAHDELLRVDAVLEGFAAIDEDDGNLFPVTLQQVRLRRDIHLSQGKRVLA